MKSLLVLLLLVAVARADVYLVDANGVWKSEVTSSGPGAWSRVVNFSPADSVIVAKIGTPNPPDEPEPPSDLVAKVTAITKETIRSEAEARALVSVIRLFRRPDVDISKAKKGLESAVTVLKNSPIFPGNKFGEWLTRVDALQLGEYDAAFIAALDRGVSNAYGFTAGAMDDDDVERINIIEIIELIKVIIQLLRDLGILGGGAIELPEIGAIPHLEKLHARLRNP